jgi:SRSO17 transposase
VFLGYASQRGRALIDRALYLPEEWAADDERRMLAGVPEDVSFATKPKLGRALLERAVAAGVPCAWVATDSVYGGDYALRLWLERQPLGYVLAVTSKQRAPSGFDSVKIRTEACFGADDWQRLSAGEGTAPVRLGLQGISLSSAWMEPAGPPVHRRPGQADLLPDLRPRRHARQHSGERRGNTVDHRVLLRSR